MAKAQFPLSAVPDLQ